MKTPSRRHLGRIAICLGALLLTIASPDYAVAVETFEAFSSKHDKNRDGFITIAEYQGEPGEFKRLDFNNNGVLTALDLARQSMKTSVTRVGPRVPESTTVLRDVVYGSGGGRDLKMHLVLPKKKSDSPTPMVVWIHGGGWRSGNKESGLRRLIPLIDDGIAGATIEYRLSGEAIFPAQIHDCKCAIRYLRAHAKELNINPDRIAVSGSSAGGHLAALMGTSGGDEYLEGDGGWEEQSSRVQAVLDLYGPTDFNAFVREIGFEAHARDDSPESLLIGGAVALYPEKVSQLNPIKYVDASDPPFLIIHGMEDRTVPLNQSELLQAALVKAGVKCKLHLIENAGHGGREFNDPAIGRMQRKFFRQELLQN